MNQNQTNNNSKAWRTKVDEFRGYVKSKLETLEKKIDEHCIGAEKRKEEIAKDIAEIKKYIAGRKAVRRFSKFLWGVFGGTVLLLFYYFLKWIIPKIIGGYVG